MNKPKELGVIGALCAVLIILGVIALIASLCGVNFTTLR